MGQGHISATTVGGFSCEPVRVRADCDKIIEKAVAGKAKILKPVQDQFYGDRSGFIQDPFGHLWGIATHKEECVGRRHARTHEELQAARSIIVIFVAERGTRVYSSRDYRLSLRRDGIHLMASTCLPFCPATISPEHTRLERTIHDLAVLIGKREIREGIAS